MSSEAPRVTDRSFLSSPIMGAAISSSSCCSLRSSLVPFGDLFGTGCGRSEAVLQTAVSHVPPLHAHAAALRLPSSFSVASPGAGAGFEHQPAAAARLPASIGGSGQRSGASPVACRGSWEVGLQSLRFRARPGRKPLGHLSRSARVARRAVACRACGSEHRRGGCRAAACSARRLWPVEVAVWGCGGL